MLLRAMPLEGINVVLLGPQLVPEKAIVIKRANLAPESLLLPVLSHDCFFCLTHSPIVMLPTML